MNLKKIIPRGIRVKLMYTLRFLPDEPYIRLFYFATTGRLLNLKNPTTFEDKQQWLKLHDRQEYYSKLADKLAVREHIKNVIGEEYSFPLLGHWESFDAIDFDLLPESFVLKCNHDSGSVRIIKSKSSLSNEGLLELDRHFSERLKRNFYYAGREYPYKAIAPCIIAEKYMMDECQATASLDDYKFFCFNGEPKIVLVVTGRGSDVRYDFYDMGFNHLSLRYGKQRSDDKIRKPPFFEEMKHIAAELTTGIPFVRLDLYAVNNQPYFGEYTFFDGGGFQYLQPEEWEYTLGSWIQLPM